LEIHCTDIIVKYEWPPNSPDFDHLTINVWDAMPQTFYKLKAKDHSGAKRCTAADIGWLAADFRSISECMCFGWW